MLERYDKNRLCEAERDMAIESNDNFSIESRLIHVVFQLNRTINSMDDAMDEMRERIAALESTTHTHATAL